MSRTLLAAAFMLITHQVSHAALVYDFRFDQTYYEASSGSTISVDVIFRETATAGEELRFFSSSDGLTGLGPIDVIYAPSAPATNVLGIAHESDIVVNPLFINGQFKSFDNGVFVASIGGSADAGIRIASNQPSHEISLGTFTFDVIGSAGETATLKLSGGAFGDVFFDNELSPTMPVSFGSANFAVTAVPEPSSIFAISLIGALALGKRQLKRRSRAINCCA